MAEFHNMFNSSVVNCLCIFIVVACIFIPPSDSSYDGTNGIESVVQEPINASEYKVYHNVSDVLAVLTDPKYKNWSLVQKLLDTWESATKPPFKKTISDKRQFPYIQVEGMNRALRRAFCRELAKGMGARYIRNIPRSFYRYRRKFAKDVEVQRAYVALGNYATSISLRYELEERPVVMGGFWMNQAALYIAKQYTNFDDFPPDGSEIYKWPKDLEKPDLVFFHNVIPESPTRKKENEALLQRISRAYLRFEDPRVIELNNTFSNMNREHMRIVRKIIRTKLQERYEQLDL